MSDRVRLGRPCWSFCWCMSLASLFSRELTRFGAKRRHWANVCRICANRIGTSVHFFLYSSSYRKWFLWVFLVILKPRLWNSRDKQGFGRMKRFHYHWQAFLIFLCVEGASLFVESQPKPRGNHPGSASLIFYCMERAPFCTERAASFCGCSMMQDWDKLW